jgi:hypothetical protein
MNPNQKSGDTDFLKTFGFVTNEARKNLVVFFLVLLVFSNAFFIYTNMQLQNELKQCSEDKLNLSLNLSEKITEEVRKQILPATTKIEEAAQKVDSVATKTNIILQNKK